MLIEKITEINFEAKVAEGEERVNSKLRNFENQIEAVAETKTEEAKRLQIPRGDIDWKSLYDPTIWAYKILKDTQFKPLRLRGYQDKIINDNHQFIVVAAANQIGKTWTACVKSLHHAVNVDNSNVSIISRSEQQAIYILDLIKQMMQRSKIPFDIITGEIENRTELHLTNPKKKGVSVIRCFPPTDAVLAFPASLIIGDEVGFWKIENYKDPIDFYERVVMSRILDTQEIKNEFFTMGQVFCLSNPNAQQGILWYLWNHPDYHQYRYNWLAKPGRTLEQYNKYKPPHKPSDVFDSVYAATFSSATGGFITLEEYEAAVRDYQVYPDESLLFMGGDYAGEDTRNREVDDNVFFGVQGLKENNKQMFKVCYYQLFPKRVKKEVTYEELKKFPNLAKFAYDKVGVGDSVKNDLLKEGFSESKIESLSYSLPNKSEVYYNLKHLFEQRKIIVPNIPKLKEQLLGLRFERTLGGHLQKPLIKVHHKEGHNDDLADALANACYAARILSGTQPFISIIPKRTNFQQLSNKLTLLVCPTCEEIDYNGEGGYYRGYSPNGKMERISCPRHSEITI